MSTYLFPRTSATVAICTVAAALLVGATGAAQGNPGSGSVPQRVDDIDRSPVAEPMWVNHVRRGSPRVDDFNVAPAMHTWVNHLHRGSPRVDDFNASPAR